MAQIHRCWTVMVALHSSCWHQSLAHKQSQAGTPSQALQIYMGNWVTHNFQWPLCKVVHGMEKRADAEEPDKIKWTSQVGERLL